MRGEIPSPLNPPKGCPFCTRCQYVIEGLCETTPPPLKEFEPRHVIACHLDHDTLRNMKPVIQIEDDDGDSAPKADPVAEMAAAAGASPAPAAASDPAPATGGDVGLAEADDLKRINGVGGVLEEKLNALGVTTFAQIAAWTADDIAQMDDKLRLQGPDRARGVDRTGEKAVRSVNPADTGLIAAGHSPGGFFF